MIYLKNISKKLMKPKNKTNITILSKKNKPKNIYFF